MESLILNVFTIGLTSCIVPLIFWYLLKRPLGKVEAIIVLVLNGVLMVVIWVMLRGLILTGDVNQQPPGSTRYIMYGIVISAFILWGIVTSQKSSGKKDAKNA